jgi:hypothetical protein
MIVFVLGVLGVSLPCRAVGCHARCGPERSVPRIVKRAISKYQAPGPAINRTSYKATLTINILTGEPP